MKSEIFLISLFLIGHALADPETTEPNEKPEGDAPAPAKEGDSTTEGTTVTDGVFVSSVDKSSEDNKTGEGNKAVELKGVEDNKTGEDNKAGELKGVEDNKALEDTTKGPETTTQGSSGEEASGMKLKEPSGTEETTTSGGKEEASDNSVKKDAGASLLDAVNNVAAETTPGSSKEETTTDNAIGLKKVEAVDQPANEETTTAGGSGEDNSNKSDQKDTTNAPDIAPQASGEEPSGKTESPEEAKPTEKPEEAKPTEKTEEAKPTEKPEEAKPTEKTEEAKPTDSAEVKAPEVQAKKVDSPSVKLFNTNVDSPKDLPIAIGLAHVQEIAEHKMTVTEQRAFVCSLSKPDLCQMVVDLQQNMSITDPSTDAYCKGLAASMGYSGHCVALMKMDPITEEPIFTRACAYFDSVRSKCSTNFITTQVVTNVSQVPYTCGNGISYYVPTSCVKRSHEIVLA